MEGQPNEVQYPGWHMDTTRKGLWDGEDNEVPEGNRNVGENIDLIESRQDHYTENGIL